MTVVRRKRYSSNQKVAIWIQLINQYSGAQIVELMSRLYLQSEFNFFVITYLVHVTAVIFFNHLTFDCYFLVFEQIQIAFGCQR